MWKRIRRKLKRSIPRNRLLEKQYLQERDTVAGLEKTSEGLYAAIKTLEDRRQTASQQVEDVTKLASDVSRLRSERDAVIAEFARQGSTSCPFEG